MTAYSESTVGGAAQARRQRGFTLIELMVALAVLAVLLGVAVPSFSDASLSSKLRSQANALVASVALGRSEAIKRNAVVTLCASSDGATCTGAWHQGWIVRAADGSVLQAQSAAPSGYRITAGSTSIIAFQPTGLGANSTTLTICRLSPSVGSQERVVEISLTGRTSVKTTTAGACPGGS
ncbi:prepilin-type N-terminal cleavage/methylation domain-containing protein [Azotobacter chroococcum subsp. isscasi]|uniref:GspH/FimT family pseudopilin n=1 Tax=Azotobacter chroococcum TaxID=353 RepID=UPI00103DB0DA|nr:GspH/FimT family pseudopilin [Azotobacter chroococcum]TBW06585.1 prepilin-type N-terminal cleavage/methylation domain-containing protein [Azotobacter chroococcum subsp. isscasi]